MIIKTQQRKAFPESKASGWRNIDRGNCFNGNVYQSKLEFEAHPWTKLISEK